MNQNQINLYEDEFIVNEILTTFKNVVLNIFIFILCIFLFMNPYLLSNVVLFISVFAFIKVAISFFSSSFQAQQPLVESTQTFHIIDDDENEILRSKIRKLKKDNTLLKDKLDNNNLKRKMKTSIPKIVSNPVEIKVQFEEKDEEKDNGINISIEKETLRSEKDLLEETLKSEEDLLKESLNNEETLNIEENFSILEKEDEWSS
uniref:Uncharacterized protein n=1 Tax=viral metagenome TaxID=1070528 RepID=A0A6C0E136_9ZZZZ